MKPRDLIVFGEDWGKLPSSTQHLMSELAKSRKVVWVNSIGMRKPQFNRRDLLRICLKIGNFMQKNADKVFTKKSTPQMSFDTKDIQKSAMVTQPNAKNVIIVEPLTIPAPSNFLLRKLATLLLSRQLQPVLAQHQLHAPIVWATLPTAADMYKKLGTSAFVYYCCDDYGALPQVDKALIYERERQISQQADLIIVTQQNLFNKFETLLQHEAAQSSLLAVQQKPRKPQLALLSHGVSLKLFAKQKPRAADLPDDGRPIAGFYGSLAAWLDYALLQKVIAALPSWHFVFIGEMSSHAACLQRYKNVHFLGPKAHHHLASYSQHWNVSLLPFVLNSQIQSCSPLKLKEYLAAARPIIATDFYEAQVYSEHIHIIKNAEQMIQRLEEIKYFPASSKQRDCVREHSWQRKAQQLSMLLEKL
ncbi:MAG: glycosyltransferase [Enterovibrio sp.]